MAKLSISVTLRGNSRIVEAPMPLPCSYDLVCSGCEWLTLSRSELSSRRKLALRDLGIDFDRRSITVDTVWIADGGLRHQLEFTFEPPTAHSKAKFGIYEKRGLNAWRTTVDLAGCPQLEPDLESWLQKFRRDFPPLKKKASIRLRVSPDGQRGLWIDTANEEIRDLLNETAWLFRQIESGVIVEMGQRRKRVQISPGRRPQLSDPVIEPWFQTLDGHKLFGTIASFSQPGWRAAAALVSATIDHLPPGLHSILEFGAGSGGFTLPLLARGHRVVAFEFDTLAVASLKKGVGQLAKEASLRLNVFEGDFIQSTRAWANAMENLDFSNLDLPEAIALVDPPRSGLGKFLQTLIIEETHLPQKWIYVSCYPESFARDLNLLQQKGFQLERLTFVEQFPYTNHFELVASIAQQPTR
jgi:23S rRNA (uracil1939-C5)-methyltransferase